MPSRQTGASTRAHFHLEGSEMALYAFDGTWNEAKDGEDSRYRNTNVVRFKRAYSANSGTDDFYVSGVGTRFDVLGRVVGGVFGKGELARIAEAYEHVCQRWEAGDHVIDIVGFSRGAATTLDFCHWLLKDGIRKPGHGPVVEPKPTIRFLGVWDTVAAFGLANLGNMALNIGHHLTLPRANLQYCFHALALDERRPPFLPTRLNGACEVWFRGAHSDIGGGNGNAGLNDVSMTWMMRKAKAAGLPISDAEIARLNPAPATPPHLDPKLPFTTRVISAVDRCHYTVSPVAGLTTPPETCRVETEADEQQATDLAGLQVDVLPIELQRQVNILWETAKNVAAQADFTLEGVEDPFISLLQGRIVLVTNEAQLIEAGHTVARLVATMIKGARARGFHTVSEFFMNEALFNMPRQFPLTD
jgi:hypothetical protein